MVHRAQKTRIHIDTHSLRQALWLRFYGSKPGHIELGVKHWLYDLCMSTRLLLTHIRTENRQLKLFYIVAFLAAGVFSLASQMHLILKFGFCLVLAFDLKRGMWNGSLTYYILVIKYRENTCYLASYQRYTVLLTSLRVFGFLTDIHQTHAT